MHPKIFLAIALLSTSFGGSQELLFNAKTVQLDPSDTNTCPKQKNSSSRKTVCPTPFQLFVRDQGFFLGAELLYWQAPTGGALEYAFVKDFPVYENGAGTVADGLAGKVHAATFDWDFGVRAMLGYQTALDFFEILAKYTYYNTQGSDIARVPTVVNPTQANQATLKAVFPTNFTVEPQPTRATSKIRLNYQVGDLMLERHFAPTRNFSFGLSGGLEGVWMDQHWKVGAFDLSGQSAFTTTTWSYWGIGPGLGLDCEWYFVKQFSMFVNVAGSLLYGTHYNSLLTRCSSGTVNDLYQKINPHNGRLASHTQIALGFSWNYRWEKKNKFFKLFAGYELNTWSNVAEVYQFHDIGLAASEVHANALYSISSYLLQLQGLSAGMHVHF